MEENYLQQENRELKLTASAKPLLSEIAKWTNFIAILGFISVGLMVLAAFGMLIGGMSSAAMMKTIFPFGGSVLIFVIYLAMAILYYFPINYLYQFSKQLKSAVADYNSTTLTSALENLKSHYKFIGVLIIVMLAIYAIMIMFAIVVGLSNI